jgi:hypothetical protein
MWICSKLGFYSIVRKPDGFHVRARTKADLVNLKNALSKEFHESLIRSLEIETWPQADYRYRIRITGLFFPCEIFAVFEVLMRTVDYANFKNEVAARPDQRAKLNAYCNLWHSLEQLQNGGPADER